MLWAIITGDYPPQPGGVSDYTWILANALMEAGDEVHVFAPRCGLPELPSRVAVHRFAGGFGPIGMMRLHSQLLKLPQPRRAILQFVVQSFGMRAMNVFFALGIRRLHGFPLWVMFHEYAIEDSATLSILHRLQALVTRLIARVVAQTADFNFYSTPAWASSIAKVASDVPSRWIPVPSNIDTETDLTEVAALRARFSRKKKGAIVGHFGSYRMRESVIFLSKLAVRILEDEDVCALVFLGHGSVDFVATLRAEYSLASDRIFASGGLETRSLANHLAACDLVVQPYPDGATTRRGSLIAGLGLGIPIVTSDGVNTEPLWEGSVELVPFEIEENVRAIRSLVRDPGARRTLSHNARDLYEKKFSISRLVTALRDEAPPH